MTLLILSESLTTYFRGYSLPSYSLFFERATKLTRIVRKLNGLSYNAILMWHILDANVNRSKDNCERYFPNLNNLFIYFWIFLY